MVINRNSGIKIFRILLVVFTALVIVLFLVIRNKNKNELYVNMEKNVSTSFQNKEYYENHQLTGEINQNAHLQLLDDYNNLRLIEKYDLAKEYMRDFEDLAYKLRFTLQKKYSISIPEQEEYYIILYINSGDKSYELSTSYYFTDSDGKLYSPEEINGNNSLSTTNFVSSTHYATDEEKTDAWICAKKAMEDNLKAPSTAKFPWYSEDFIEPLGSNRFQVTAYVDAENGFGAKIRTNFTVTVEIINNGKGFKYSDLLTY